MMKMSLAGLILLFCISVNAQDKPVTFGVKAGMNISNLTDDFDDCDAKVGFNIGVTLDYAITPDIYLLTGLDFTTKGAKLDDDLKLNLSYLQLPIHVGYKLTISDATKIGFHAGPYLAYGVDGSWKAKGGSLDVFGDDAFLKMKRFDFGIGGGAFVEFDKFNIGLSYDLGLTNISDFDNGVIEGIDTSDISTKNVAAYLTVGYKF